MTRIHLAGALAVLLLALGLGVPRAQAEVALATAEQVVRESGLATQLQQIPQAMDTSLGETAQAMGLPPEAAARMRQAAQSAFQPQRLLHTVVLVVSRESDAAQLQDALRWYRSPDGRRVIALEDAALAPQTADMQAWLAEANREYAAAPEQRRALLGAAEQASRAAELMADLQILIGVATLQGIAAIAPPQFTAELRRNQQELLRQRPQTVAATRGLALAVFAATYAPLSDAELGRYVDFLKSAAAQHTHDVLLRALGVAMSEAAEEFGRSLVTGLGAPTS